MKNILIVALTLLLIIPQIALAAWWNPFSWFKVKKSDTQLLVAKTQDPDNREEAPEQKPNDPLVKVPLGTSVATDIKLETKKTIATGKKAPSLSLKNEPRPSTVIYTNEPVTLIPEYSEVVNYKDKVKSIYQQEIKEFIQAHKIEEILRDAVKYKISDLNESVLSFCAAYRSSASFTSPSTRSMLETPAFFQL